MFTQAPVYVFSNLGSFYRCSKAACENYIDVYQKQHGLDYTIFRYGTIYGTRADERNNVCQFITQAMEEKKITYQGDGSEIREYVNVLDAAKASVEILSDEFRNEHVIFTGHYPMKEVFIMIKEMLKDSIEFEFVTQTTNNPMVIIP